MGLMNEKKKNEEFDDEFNEEFDDDFNGFDPTKEAFFSDMLEMENEILDEAFSLVEHSLSLIESKYYDDAIEILRQASGLYKQINKPEEIEIIKNKISEIYLMKESAFREEEGKVEIVSEAVNEEQAYITEQYDDTMEKPLEGKSIDQVKDIEQVKPEIDIQESQSKLLEEGELKEKRIKEYESEKKRVKELSNQAYDLMGEAIELVNNKEYLNALELYENASTLFKEIGWENEWQKVDKSITHLHEEYEVYKEKLEKQKVEEEATLEAERKEAELLAQKAEELKKQQEIAKIEKIQDFEAKKIEKESFEKLITDLVDEADHKVRNYENAIKKGKYEMECPYEEVIQIYEKIKDLVREKGWKDRIRIYLKQINIFKEKLEKDKKLREIEAQKAEKEITYKEMLRVKKEEKITLDANKLKEIEELRQKELEEDLFRQDIEKIVSNAEKMAREYDLAIRKGIFEIECVYPEIIKKFKKITNLINERGWKDEVPIYITHIRKYQDKLEKDKKLREIEAQKARKQREYKEIFKVTEADKIKEVIRSLDREEQMLEIEDKKRHEEYISNKAFNLIDEGEKLVKKYELKKRKEILIHNSPYEEVVSLYKEAIKLFNQIGWKEESERLLDTIHFYREKKVKDDKLRELEKQKLHEKRIEIKPSEKRGEKITLKHKEKLYELEKQKKENEKRAQEIFEMIDAAEKLVKDYESNIQKGFFPESPYEDTIKIYREAKKKFEEIGWKEQATSLLNAINHYKEKLESDNRLRALETEKKKKKEMELKEIEEITVQSRIKEEEITKKKREALILKKKKETEEEKLRNEAFELLDHAKFEFNQKNYDKSIELYEQGKNIFSDIGWEEGKNMVLQSIRVIKKKQEELKYRQKIIQEKETERLKIEKHLEEKFELAEDVKKIEREKKKERLLKMQEEKSIEQEISERAYDLLAEGSKFAEKKKFSEAYENYIKARDLFKEIKWHREVSRINNEFLFNLKREENKVARLEAHLQEKMKKEQDLEELLKKAEVQKKKLEKSELERKRKTLTEHKREDKLIAEWERANAIIDNYNYNEGVLELQKIKKIMEKADRQPEIAKINQQISNLKQQSHVPLITLEELDKIDDMKKFKVAYNSLDKAQASLSRKLLMKAVSELKEAIFYLKDLALGKKYLKEIEEKINEIKKEIEKKRE